ncbi:TSUP family transporter [Microbacterium sp. JB110]|uniref:TSUP family transporter n=1 Tax=Microbacterium sp. JB110 TaxID=2024477 RepID=UPI00097ED2A8|nr:TSUP family transporter [Microbacterium sp. JB110]RCS60814.1 sulfite exporter TauE/SafE family protein [Microbacterium sp. JB110]SJM64594.1 putative integral membrane protein [Frigoribacterium sp. JB110]
MPEIDVLTLVLLLVAALAAGWVDAVVGGGGLIQLPALMLAPGIAPLQALATNKLSSVMGTAVAATTYSRRVKPDPRTAVPLALAALAGAVFGAALATLIPAEAFDPIILVVLIGVGAFTVFKPKMGVHTNRRWHGWKHVVAATMIGLFVGTYDGALGPGTGSFFVILFVSVLGYAFMPASAFAKIANLCTNIGALIFFIPAGHVIWGLGLAMGAANLVGAYIGARMALSKGSRFVRVVFIVVIAALVAKISWDMITGG